MAAAKIDNTKKDFEDRKAEIEEYFVVMSTLDNDNTEIRYKKEDRFINEKIPLKFKVILLSNAFLILYNLIESTIRNSIIEIYTKIEGAQVCYEKLSNNLKKIWIKQNTDNFREGSYNPTNLHNHVFKLAEQILSKENVNFSREQLDFSGNLDARKIREIAEKVGFKFPADGRGLEDIKNRRNRLAHGEQTFYEVGKDFSIKDLNNFKNETFKYLQDVISNIEKFLLSMNI